MAKKTESLGAETALAAAAEDEENAARIRQQHAERKARRRGDLIIHAAFDQSDQQTPIERQRRGADEAIAEKIGDEETQPCPARFRRRAGSLMC